MSTKGREDRQLLEKAFTLFLDKCDANVNNTWSPFPYDFCRSIKNRKWNHITGWMIYGDLNESINILNAWKGYLFDWAAWLNVLTEFEDMDAWIVQSAFIEPLSLVCMLQPSATRDRLGSIATQAIHQANIRTKNNYPDHLEQDGSRKNGFKEKYLNRRETEQQLKTIGKTWSSYNSFELSLKTIDSPSFRRVSRDFRNRYIHNIAPRLQWGEVRFVTRSAGPWHNTVKQSDGSHYLEEDIEKTAVSYSFGGESPVSFDALYKLCSEQHGFATVAFNEYQNLLDELSR